MSIILGPKGDIDDITFDVRVYILQHISCISLLGVNIDDRFFFDDHISSICNLSSQPARALRRIVKYISIKNQFCIYNALMYVILIIVIQPAFL